MSEAQGGQSNGQVPTDDQGQVPSANTNSSVTPQVGDSGSPGGGDTPKPQLTLEQALDALNKARGENAQFRTQLKTLADLEKKVKGFEEANLSAQEKAEKQFRELQTKHSDYQQWATQRIVKAEVKAAAGQFGVKPDLAARLIDYSEIEFDDATGEPSNLPKLLKALVEQYPELAAGQAAAQTQATTSRAATTPTNPARSGQYTGTAIPVTPDEYLALRQAGRRGDDARAAFSQRYGIDFARAAAQNKITISQ